MAAGLLPAAVGDAALLLDVLSGNVDGDRHCPPVPPEPFTAAAVRDPGILRIGLALNVPFSGSPAALDPVVQEAVEGIASSLEDLGHEVEPVEVPYGLAPGAGIMPRSMVGIREWVGRAPDRSQLDPRTHHAARLGRAFRPDRRRLPLRLALEHPRLARPQRPRRVHRRGASPGSAVARPGQQRAPPPRPRRPARGRASLA